MLQELLTKGIGHTEFKKTEIGEIPVGWEVVDFDSILQEKDSLSYGILQPSENISDGIPMLRAVDIQNGRLSGTEIFKVSSEIEKKFKKTRLNGDEILLSVMGTLGRTILVDKEWQGWNVNRALAVIRVNSSISREYLNCWLNAPSIQAFFEIEGIGSAQKRINLKDLRRFKLPLPSLYEQKKISNIHKSFLNCELKQKEKLRSLFETKKGLMQDLLTGKVRVEVER